MSDSIIGPKNLEEFENRLSDLMYYLHDCFFGYTYEVSMQKTLRRDKSPETLVEAMCDFEKYCQEKKNES